MGADPIHALAAIRILTGANAARIIRSLFLMVKRYQNAITYDRIGAICFDIFYTTLGYY